MATSEGTSLAIESDIEIISITNELEATGRSIETALDLASLASFKGSSRRLTITSNTIQITPRPSGRQRSVESNSKIWCRIQYITFSLISMISAFAVMIIWYSVWLKDNKGQSSDVNVSHTNASISSLGCPVWEVVGDGYCDDEANIPECGYDFQDCCQMESDRSFCQNCQCIVTQVESQSYLEERCAEILDWTVGNGACNPEHNRVEYFFDIGDCCLSGDDFKCQYTNGTKSQLCLENPCIVSNNFCIPEELGDGVCQDHNNGPFCDYDMGDCSLDLEDALDQCCSCSMKEVDEDKQNNFLVLLGG